MPASTIPASSYSLLQHAAPSTNVSHATSRGTLMYKPAHHSMHADREYYKSTQCEFSPEYLAARDDTLTDDQLRTEECIHAEIQRALLAQKRARAKKAAQLAASLAYGPQTQHGDTVPEAYQPLIRRRRVYHDNTCTLVASSGHPIQEVHTFRFPRNNNDEEDEGIIRLPCSPSSSPKKLAPLSRFNPFLRTRAESLSSIVDGNDSASSYDNAADEEPVEFWRKKLRRAAIVADLFARINREAKKVPSQL